MLCKWIACVLGTCPFVSQKKLYVRCIAIKSPMCNLVIEMSMKPDQQWIIGIPESCQNNTNY